ncbi:MAG: tetratricopeptide repeat protein [Bacteroidaceae bacterium]|nr:tetratricopeptide repeat protein [Bacteroidaceae bacterium]
MIKREDFNKMAQEARGELIAGHLTSMLRILGDMATAINAQELASKVNDIADDYNRILSFVATGGTDPKRNEQYERIKRHALNLLQSIRRQYRLNTSNDTYTRIHSSYALKPQENVFDLIYNWKDTEPLSYQDAIFELLWTAPSFNNYQEQQTRLLLCTLKKPALQYAISAIVVSLVEYFDVAKLRILLEYCTDDITESVRARALVGLILVIVVHDDLIALFPTLQQTIDQLSLQTALTIVQRDLILTAYSEEVREKITRDILPRLKSIQEKQQKQENDQPVVVQLSFQQLARELLDLQILLENNGADNAFSAFQPYEHIPFMSRPCHWLAPFQQQRPEASNEEMLHDKPISDVEKYVLSALLDHSNDEQREELKEHLELLTPSTDSSQDHLLSAQQAFRRFFLQSPWKEEMPEVLRTNTTYLLDNPLLREKLADDSSYLWHIGSLLLKFRQYKEAYHHLETIVQPSAEVLAKMGECQKALEESKKALRLYQQAELLAPDDVNILRHLDDLYDKFDMFEERLANLLHLRELTNESDTTGDIGECLCSLGRYDEAIQEFYKLDFEFGNEILALRELAPTFLRMGDAERSLKNSQRLYELTEDDFYWEDYLCMAAARWALNDTQNAIADFTKACQEYEEIWPEVEDPLCILARIEKNMQQYGKTKTDFLLLHDLIASRL